MTGARAWYTSGLMTLLVLQEVSDGNLYSDEIVVFARAKDDITIKEENMGD